MGIRVVAVTFPCMLQDAGRPGYRAFGVPLSGPMDSISFRMANLLCGNPANSTALEITLHGLMLYVAQDCLMACCGGGAVLVIDGKPVRMDRPVFVRAGTLVAFRPHTQGCRSYLAVAGGFQANCSMGSRSTYVPAAIGGYDGRVLRKDDVLMVDAPPSALSVAIQQELLRGTGAFTEASWGGITPTTLMAPLPCIRILEGPEWSDVEASTQALFLSEEFKVSDRSDRMGYQLEGPTLSIPRDTELISTAVCPGTIQVTPGGVAVMLMADAQTTGGYPRIAQVITADLPRCGQLRPGRCFHMDRVGFAEAELLFRAQEFRLRQLGASIRLRFGR